MRSGHRAHRGEFSLDFLSQKRVVPIRLPVFRNMVVLVKYEWVLLFYILNVSDGYSIRIRMKIEVLRFVLFIKACKMRRVWGRIYGLLQISPGFAFEKRKPQRSYLSNIAFGLPLSPVSDWSDAPALDTTVENSIAFSMIWCKGFFNWVTGRLPFWKQLHSSQVRKPSIDHPYMD